MTSSKRKRMEEQAKTCETGINTIRSHIERIRSQDMPEDIRESVLAELRQAEQDIERAARLVARRSTPIAFR